MRSNLVSEIWNHVFFCCCWTTQLRNLGPSTVNARVQVEFPTHHHGDVLLYVFANASEDFLTCHTDSPDIDPYQVREVAWCGPAVCQTANLSIAGKLCCFSMNYVSFKRKSLFYFIFALNRSKTRFSIVLLMMFWSYEIGVHSFVLAVGEDRECYCW